MVVNLDELYRYMTQRLLQANISNEAAWLDEVSTLLREIKTAWEQIPPEARKVTRESSEAEAEEENQPATKLESVAI